MTSKQAHRRRLLLIALLVVAVLVLAVVAAVLVPILTHRSAGGSGQEVPDAYVSQVSAVGADGRTRSLTVTTAEGEPADLSAVQPGETLIVRGDGFDASIGIYLAFCAIPDSPNERPSPCLGGIPDTAETGEAAETEIGPSAWITDAWAWRAFATHGYDDSGSGSFEVRLTVPPVAEDGADCRVSQCALATRADHTASGDRVQDMLLPVAWAQ